MLVAGQPQITGLGAFFGGGFNYNAGANSLLGGYNGFGNSGFGNNGFGNNAFCGGNRFGGMGGFGGMNFGGMAGWGAAWKSDIYNMQEGKAWDTTLASTLGQRDPVYLDTNRDGKLNVEGGKNVNFDINGDGIADQVHEWNTQDAQLVFDANNNNKIDNGREIMNETGINGEQNKYKNGWEKAQDLFDADKNGSISGEELAKAKFWTDTNGNGQTDEGELKTAAELNIVGIDTKNGKFVTKEKVGEMHGMFGGFGGFGGSVGGGFGGGYNCGWGRSGWGMGNQGFGGFGGFGGGYAGGFFGGASRLY